MLVVLVVSSTVITMGLPMMLSMVSSVMSMMVSRIWMRGGVITLDVGHIVPFVDEL